MTKYLKTGFHRRLLSILWTLSVVMSLPILANAAGNSAITPCVSKTYTSAMDVYLEAYSQARFIGFGHIDHTDYRPIHELKTFLDKVGKDENLKYVFVELPQESLSFFTQLDGSLEMADVQRLGMYGGWFLYPWDNQVAQEYENIYVTVLRLNKTRKSKLAIVPIDSAFSRDGVELHKALAWDREHATVQYFDGLAQGMRATDKAIFYYHAYHLTQNVKGSSYDYEVQRYRFDNVSFLGQSRIVNKDNFRLIGFDKKQSFFNTTLLKSSSFGYKYYKTGDASGESCFSDTTYYDYYVSDVLFPTRIGASIHYVVNLEDVDKQPTAPVLGDDLNPFH